MIKKKDYELIAEAYARIGTLNECWEKMSAPQKSKVEDILKSKSGYKIGDQAWSDEKKTVTLTHELGSEAERDIVVDDKGEEVVHTHSGPHNESIESQSTFDPDELTRKFINDARQAPENHKAHGSLAALRFLKGKKEGIVPENPHVKGSPASQNWQEGWNEIMEMDDKAGKAEVQAGKVHTTPAGAAPGYDVVTNAVKESAETLEEKKMACGKGCTCKKCPKCMPKKKSMKKALEEAYEAVLEEAKKKMSRKMQKEVGKDVEKEMKKGHKQDQAVAIALNKAGVKKK